MNRELILLGTGDAFGTGGKSGTSFLLKAEEMIVLMDCAATTINQLNTLGLPPQDIDVIVISHFHGDHYGGVPNLLLDARFINNREKPLHIVTPKGGERRVLDLFRALYLGSEEILSELDIKWYEFNPDGPVYIGDLKIESWPVLHKKESLPHGYKVTCGTVSVGFSGDTQWTDQLFEIAEGTDIFICECNFRKKVADSGHLSYEELAPNRNRFNTKRMLLTHFGRDMIQDDEPLMIEAGKDLMRIPL